jgi:hypothetical protein
MFGSIETISKKINDAFQLNPTKTIQTLDELNIWDHIPLTEVVRPYYIKRKTNV